MANSRRKNQETKVSEDIRGKANDNATKQFQDGDVHAAILELIGTDEDVMKSIVDSVSQVIVTKLLTNETFITKLADGLMKDGVLDAIKQNVYEACALEDQKISSTVVESLERRVGDLDNDNRREELDKMEQYSRRNCLVVHGIPESETKERLLRRVTARFQRQTQRVSRAPMHRPEPTTRPLPAIVEQATTCHREIRELRDPPSSVLGQATIQRNQYRCHREYHQAEKRPTESDESTARRQGSMDD